MFVDFKTVSLIWPEITLVFMATAIMLCGALDRPRNWWHPVAMLGYVAVVVMLRFMPIWGPLRGEPSGPFSVDYLGNLVRGVALLVGLLFTMMTIRRQVDATNATTGRWDNEFIGAIMLIVTGLMLLSQVNDLILLFVAMEMVSIPTYVVLYLGRRSTLAAESTMKYFFLGILSSALMLYGFSFLYGITGTSVLVGTAETPGMREILTGEDSASRFLTLMQIGIVLTVAGIGFKIAAVPFHFYAPDVFQGTSNSNAGLLAVAPKIAGIIALVRLLATIMPSHEAFAWQLLMVLALLTMTVGNVCALWQRNVRRLLAFSSIAHAGYMLIGITVALASDDAMEVGLAGTIFYLIVYTFASIGTFAALVFLSQDREVSHLHDLRGLSQSQPIVAAALAIFMFSLAGIPPLAGFWGKMTLFGGAIRMATNDSLAGGDGVWFAVLAAVGALNAAIAATYYLRVIAIMFFQAPQTRHESTGSWGSFAAMLSCSLLVIVVGIFPGSAVQSSNMAARSSRPAEPAVSTVSSTVNSNVSPTR